MRAFGRSDQLNHLFRAAEPFLYAICFGAERLRRQLRGHSRFAVSGVFGDEANFVEANSGMGAEIGFEAFGEACGLDSGLHERADETHEIIARDAWAEADAGDARIGE